MSDIEKLYKKGATVADNDMLKRLIISEVLGWEDSYWAAKCLWEEDTDELDTKIVESALNYAFRFGLTYNQNRGMYLDSNKILATIYSQQHEYDAVLNCLGLVLEWEPNSPDWVFHDFVSAQIHANYMKGILRNPKVFLLDLARNDSGSDKVKRRQKSIFKDFLIQAILFLKDNPDSQVNDLLIQEAAETYEVINTDGWKAFCEIRKGNITTEIAPVIAAGKEELPSVLATPVQTTETEDYPLIVNLFPEDNTIPIQTVSIEEHKRAIDQKETLEKENIKLKEEGKKADNEIKALKAENKKLQAEKQATEESNKTTQEESSKKTQIVLSENELLKSENPKLKDAVKEVSDNRDAAQRASAKKTNEIIAESQKKDLKIDALEAEGKRKDEKIDALEAEGKRKDAEIVGLKAAAKNSPAPADTKEEVLGKMQGYLYSIQVSLSGFLGHELPLLSEYWWDDFVIPAMSGLQRTEIEESGATSLSELDLASLLRIFKRWFFKISRNTTRYFSENSKESIDKVLQVRNDWAHIPVAFPTSLKIVSDLDILIDFMGTVGCGKAKVDEARVYQKQIRSRQ